MVQPLGTLRCKVKLAKRLPAIHGGLVDNDRRAIDAVGTHAILRLFALGKGSVGVNLNFVAARFGKVQVPLCIVSFGHRIGRVGPDQVAVRPCR